MKRTLLLLALAASLLPARGAAQDEEQRVRELSSRFIVARQAWEASVSDYAHNRGVTLAQTELRAQAAQQALHALPPQYQPGAYERISHISLETAEACAAKGLYKEALEYLNREMDLQYSQNPPGRLRDKTDAFFEDLAVLEAEILGHLDRSAYPRNIDHFLLPVDVDNDGTDEFIAMYEPASQGTVGGVKVPPMPEGTVRKTFLLLVKGDGEKYVIRDSIGVLAAPGQLSRTQISQQDGRTVLTSNNTRFTLKLNPDGIPVAYEPAAGAIVRLEVTKQGLKLLP